VSSRVVSWTTGCGGLRAATRTRPRPPRAVTRHDAPTPGDRSSRHSRPRGVVDARRLRQRPDRLPHVRRWTEGGDRVDPDCDRSTDRLSSRVGDRHRLARLYRGWTPMRGSAPRSASVRRSPRSSDRRRCHGRAAPWGFGHEARVDGRRVAPASVRPDSRSAIILTPGGSCERPGPRASPDSCSRSVHGRAAAPATAHAARDRRELIAQFAAIRTSGVIGGLYLAPFAGIVFRFIAVIRPDRRAGPYATVFFDSGLLFVAILFATVAVACPCRRPLPGAGRPIGQEIEVPALVHAAVRVRDAGGRGVHSRRRPSASRAACSRAGSR
jgi:hypothetical protein